MATLNEIETWLQDRLPALIAEHEVPGTAVGVLFGGEVIDHAAGVLSKATGVETTADSVFQIGSITKVWTTTLVMQLVDEGMVDLDKPVRDYLPEFVHRATTTRPRVITVRQLLSHRPASKVTSSPRPARATTPSRSSLATLAEVGQLFPPGELFSYNNAGFRGPRPACSRYSAASRTTLCCANTSSPRSA